MKYKLTNEESNSEKQRKGFILLYQVNQLCSQNYINFWYESESAEEIFCSTGTWRNNAEPEALWISSISHL
jgi:hypothetical protein